LYLRERQDCADAGFDLRAAGWRTFRDISERFVDLLKGAFRIAQFHRRYLEGTASASTSQFTAHHFG